MTSAALTAEDVALIRRVLLRTTAMQLGEGKESFLEARLRSLTQQLGLGSLSELLSRLKASPTIELESRVAEVMTVNETLFFRDTPHFEALKTEVLPRIVAQRGDLRRLDIWSAACSTGQEAVSVAILLREHFPELRLWNVRIHATDVSQRAVDRTREARYNELEIGRGLSGCLRDKYFRRSGAEWQAVDDVRALIEARQMNLAQAWPAMPGMDVVLLRNVLIYFDLPTRRAILTRTRERMRADGALFLGSAETTLHVDDAWQAVISRGSAYYVPITTGGGDGKAVRNNK